MNVLIVDDNSAVRRALRALFESDTAFDVCGEAENGRDALEKAIQLRPDLVVIDLSMPVMNGLDASRALTLKIPGISIILFSGFSDVLTRQEARSVGIAALVSKSEPSSLLEVAHEVLRQNAA
jgi:DNA-binding NarL/FixJ family response regulator